MPGPGVRPLRSVELDPPVPVGEGLTGRVIDGRYRLLHPIAEGPASTLYRAEHVRMGKVLCVKLLRGRPARDRDRAARFRSEARIVSRLSHPHTVAVFDFGELEGREGLYLAMEYLDGETLQEALRREGRFPGPRAAAIAVQLLGALGEAHEAGIVHRDVKPANVILVQHRHADDFVKLVDFGIAGIEGQGTAGEGTPTYLSPEQAAGAAPDARSDLYSLGVMLYELIGGRPPHVAPNPLAVLAAHLHAEPAPLPSLAPDVAPELAAVVHRALAKRPEDRFPSADAMREALRRAVGDAEGEPSAGDEPPREVTGDFVLARRGDFPLVAPPARKDPRRALLPAAAAIALALAVLFAASRVSRHVSTEVEEVEPNDAPVAEVGSAAPGGIAPGSTAPGGASGMPTSGVAGYAAWRDLARRNALGDADVVRARTGGSDVDTFAIQPHPRDPIPGDVLLVPQPGLALDAEAWAPPGPGTSARTGFAPLARAGAGEPILVRLPVTPSPERPVLLRVRAAAGEGGYRVVALGSEGASGRALLSELATLEASGRPAEALLVASAFARLEPGSPARPEVLRVAARLAGSGAGSGAGAGNEKGAGPGGPTP